MSNLHTKFLAKLTIVVKLLGRHAILKQETVVTFFRRCPLALAWQFPTTANHCVLRHIIGSFFRVFARKIGFDAVEFSDM